MKNRVRGMWMLVSMVVLMAICFLGEVILVDDKSVSAIEVILFHPNIIKQCEYLDVLSRGIQCDWFYLLLPIMISLPTVVYICDENTTMFNHQIVSRIGKKRYFHCSLFGVIAASMMVVLGSFLLFGGASMMIFPMNADYGNIQIVETETNWHKTLDILVQIIQVLVYTGLLAMISYMMTCISSNKYVVITSVFLFNYAVYERIQRESAALLLLMVVIYMMAGRLFKERWKFV